jgi:putative FmdB family regulatory protein
MPIYEYECGACGTRVEALVRNEKDVPKTCGKCGEKLKKALSGFSVSRASSTPKHEPSAACASCPSRGCPHSH